MKQIARSRKAGAAAPLLLFGSLALCPLLDNQPAEAQIASDNTLSTTLNVNGAVDITGGKIFSNVAAGGVGDGGIVTINSGSLSLQDGGQIQASVREKNDTQNGGVGKAGNVLIDVDGEVKLSGRSEQTGTRSAIFTDVDPGAVGNAGNIQIKARSLTLSDGAFLENSTGSQGDAGNITVDVDDAVTLSNDANIFSNVERDAVATGEPSSVTINAGSLLIADGESSISTSTFGNGDAGNVTLNVNGAVDITGGTIFSNVAAGGVGDGGTVTINSGSLSLQDGGQITASVIDGGVGKAGNVLIDVEKNVNISGNDSNGNFSAIFSSLGTGAKGNAGNIEIAAGSLTLEDGGFISTSTFGEGRAGNITVDVDSAVTLSNDGDIFSRVETGAVVPEGEVGTVNIKAGSFLIADGDSSIETSTSGTGDAGNVTLNVNGAVDITGGKIFSNVAAGGVGDGGTVTINSGSLSLQDGGQIQTLVRQGEDDTPAGQGNAGIVRIEADTVSFDGVSNDGQSSSGVFSTVEEEAIGNAGGIEINTGNLFLTNEATLSANSFGEGNGGNITIEANNLTLRNGNITAATSFGEGGNIKLTVDELLQMRDNSQISARAIEDANGGNIDIDARFVIAYPSQTPNNGNDIIASAERGRGGNININTQQIFGLQERRATPGNGTNDIDASSEFGLSGEVVITNLIDDINQGVVESPDNVVEPETVTAQACPAAGRVARGESSFTITGRGGLPALATDPLNSDQISIEGDDAAQSSKKSSRGIVTVTEQPNPPSSKDIVPARGMIVNEKGEIVLTAYPTPNTSQRTPTSSVRCTGS
jgi:large exoprotein involved in heme utilization and adhesion